MAEEGLKRSHPDTKVARYSPKMAE